MTPQKPRVSVGVPVCNGEKYIATTLEHVRAQSFENIEIIVSDNGSTDATPTICRAAATDDRRIKYYRSDRNMGAGWNFNRVLELATAPNFMWNAADDLLAPTYIEKCMDALDRNLGAVIAFSRVNLIDSTGAVVGELGDRDLDFTSIRPSRRVHHFLVRQAVHIEYGIMRTEHLRALGGEPAMHGGDVVLGVTMLMTGSAVMVPEQLFSARRHAEQGSLLRTAGEQLREHHPDARIRPVFPQWRIVSECARRISAAPLAKSERIACLRALVTGWVIPRRRSYLSDIKRNVLMYGAFLRQRRAMSKKRTDREIG